MLTIEYQYVRIYTNSVGMQAVVERTLAETDTDVPQDDILPMNLEPRDYDFIQEVVDGSCQILQKVVQLSESGALRYSPVRIFLRITTSSIYLIKGLSLGSRNQKLQSSLDILDAARDTAEPFTIVIPPPNVTGSLHIGHALDNTLQDILIRHARLQGKDALWVVGTDHAGIATQMVVERQLMERQQPGRRDMGREAFLQRVWEWKAESGGTIIRQLKWLGASCDWSRERFTMDDGLSRAVLKVFVALYREGLIYKDKRLVNWDPKLKTAISDLEVQQVETKGNLWHIKYPIENAD